jgi:ClpP class serine protease
VNIWATIRDRQQRALDRVRVLLSGNVGAAGAGERGVRAQLRVKNAADGESTDVYLYDAIGGWFGVTAEQFSKSLSAIETPTINLHINSPGGDVFDGTAIYNAIQQHRPTSSCTSTASPHRSRRSSRSPARKSGWARAPIS